MVTNGPVATAGSIWSRSRTRGIPAPTAAAAAVGAGIPLVLERLQIDPAVATGPFVTTAVDVLGLLFYFGLASVMLELPL